MKREISEEELTLQVQNALLNALKGKNLKVYRHEKWVNEQVIKYFDIVIYRGTNPLAIFEVRRSSRQSLPQYSAVYMTNVRFVIETNGELYYLFDRNHKEPAFEQVTLEEIIQKLSDSGAAKLEKSNEISNETNKIIENIIVTAAEKNLPDNFEFIDFIKKNFKSSKIRFNQEINTFYWGDENKGATSFENRFFNLMFGEFKETQICRYTSLKTIFDMINNTSIRLNSLMGMNDKSEIDYVDKYLFGNELLTNLGKPLAREHYSKITALNSRYITSCSKIDNKDNLTLWRLYADDARGVCLIFDVNHENLNNFVLLQKICYGTHDNFHPELKLLKEIMSDIREKTGKNFEFKKLEYWKHFFKPDAYSIEEEVRLLIFDNSELNKLNTDWMLTNSHNIINPIINFGLNSKSFPIKLSKIILGPKCPEQDLNKVQLEEMIRRKRRVIREQKIDSDIDSLKVEISQINHYR